MSTYRIENIVGTKADPAIMFNKDYMSYKKIECDEHTSHVLSIHPRHVEFLDYFAPPNAKTSYLALREPSDSVFRRFYISDSSRNQVVNQHPKRTYQYIDKAEKNLYINNLSMPSHLELWIALADKKYPGWFKRHYDGDRVKPEIFLNYTDIKTSDTNLEEVNLTGFQHPEAVLDNSHKNPLKMKLHTEKKINCCEFVDYVAVTRFADTGTVYFNFNVTGFAYNQKKDQFFRHRNDRYSLKIRNQGKRTSFLKNGRLIYGLKLIEAFSTVFTNSWIGYSAYKKEKSEYSDNIFLRLLEKYFLGQSFSSFMNSDGLYADTGPQKLARLYQVRRNRQLSDLPWADHDLINIYTINEAITTGLDYKKRILARNNMNRYLRKGDTKRASEFAYYGFKFPKAMRKLLLKVPPLSLYYESAQLLYQVYEKYDTNIALNIMKDDAGEINLSYLNSRYYLLAILLGFKKNRLMRAGLDMVEDAMIMKCRLEELCVNTTYRTNNFVEYHDYLSNLYTSIMASTASVHNMAFKAIDTSKQLPSMQINGYTLRSPVSTSELIDVGSDMRHCVASYCHRYYYRQLEILLVEKDGTYVACVEIQDKNIVQAKLKFNEPVINNPKVFNALAEWATENGYTLACSDCGTEPIRNNSSTQKVKCKKRLASVARMNYIKSMCRRKFSLAHEAEVKEILSPKWLTVLDCNCSINKQDFGTALWSNFKSEDFKSEGRISDSIPF